MSDLLRFLKNSFSSNHNPRSINDQDNPHQEVGVRVCASNQSISQTQQKDCQKWMEESNQISEGTYAEYRKYCIQILTNYLYNRFFFEKDGNNTAEQGDESSYDGNDIDIENDDDNDGNDQFNCPDSSPRLQSQLEPESQSTWTTLTKASKTSCKAQLPKIPLVQNTLHTVHTISQIDMYTKTLHLNLCKVEKVWPLRLTKRMEKACLSELPQPEENLQSPFSPNLLYPSSRHLEDGPLSCIYKYVLTLELSQLVAPQEEVIHQTASKVDPQGRLVRRLMVYLYNDYAKNVYEFLIQRIDTNWAFYSRLDGIPAACIFPYSQQQQRKGQRGGLWFDDDLCDYVLCIGGKSQCQIDRQNTRLYFENETLKLYMMAVPDNDLTNTVQECCFDCQGASSINDGLLHNALIIWKEQHERGTLQTTPPPNIMLNPEENSTMMNASSNKSTTTAIPESKTNRKGESINDGEPQRAPQSLDKNQSPAKKRPKMLMPCTPKSTYELLIHLRSVLERSKTLPCTAKGSPHPSVTVLGVILGFNLPTRTKTNQWMISISIVDPSLPTTDDDQSEEGLHTITVNVFRKKRNDLPCVRQVGDLIRLQDAGIQDFRGEMQLLGRHGTKINVYSRNPSLPQSSFASDSAGKFIVHEEFEIFQTLWEWGQKRMATRATVKRGQRFKLSDLGSLQDPGDCTAMVCGLFQSPVLTDRPIPKGFVRLWDGTGAPISDPLPLQSAEARSMIRTGDPPKEAMVSLHSTIQGLNKSPYRTESAAELSEVVALCGRVVNMAVWESTHWDFLQSTVRVGNFLRLRSVGNGALSNGLTCVMVEPKSWVVPIPDDTFEVRQLLVNHQLRINRNDSPNPNSCLLPITFSLPPGPRSTRSNEATNHQGKPCDKGYREIEKSLKCNDNATEVSSLAMCESGPEGRYSCRFSITSILPDCNGDVRHLCYFQKSDNHENNNKNDVNDDDSLSSYRFAVHLKDASSDLIALVIGKVGEVLLGGLSAVDACGFQRENNTNEVKRRLSYPCQPNLIWRGVVESRVLDEEIFFILISVESSQEV